MQPKPAAFEFYVAACSQVAPFFTLESRWWCDLCQDWHEAELVGDFEIKAKLDGDLVVTGRGYYEQSDLPD